MALLKKRNRTAAEIPTASMADIAFLLLIFFLVTTTIDVDTGIGLVLPPPLEEDQEPPPIKERNMLAILVNANGDILIEEQPASIRDVGPEIKKHTLNQGQDPRYAESIEQAIVSLKTDRQTPYDVYVAVLDAYFKALREIRDDEARRQGFPNYATYVAALPDGAEDMVKEKFKARLSIAEPDPGTE